MIQLQNLQAEKVILGSILTVPQSLIQAKRILKPECFTDKHIAIYKAMLDADNAGLISDMANTTLYYSKSTKNADVTYILELTQMYSRDISGAIKSVYELYMKHEALKALQKGVTTITHADDIFTALNNLKQELTLEPEANNIKTVHDIQAQRVEELVQANGMYKEVPYMPSGLESLDMITRGFQRGHVWVFGGDSGTGKTSFTLQIAQAANKFGYNGVFFSLEMKASEIASKMLASKAGINPTRLRIGKVTDAERQTLQAILNQDFDKGQLLIDDTAGASLTYIQNQLQILKKTQNIDFAIIDYMQLIQHSSKQARDERTKMNEITQTLKRIAKDLDITIFPLSQLSRGVNQNNAGRPRNKDLKESGSIVQDSDGIVLLYRPELYGVEQMPDGTTSSQGFMEIIVSKNRAGGELGSIWTKYEHNGGIFLDAGKDYEDAKGFEYYTTSLLDEKKYDETENNFDPFCRPRRA